MVREAAMCRDCVKTQNKIEREKIDLLKRALFNYFNTGNGFPTHDFLENDRIFLFLHSLCPVATSDSTIKSIICLNAIFHRYSPPILIQAIL